jgi:tetratricopeptide (TPR) repeat protein
MQKIFLRLLLMALLGTTLGAANCWESSTCAEEALRSRWKQAEKLCRREYSRDQDPRAGLWLARALNQERDYSQAMLVASLVADTLRSIDAYLVLAYAANRAEDFGKSQSAAESALRLSLQEGNIYEFARSTRAIAIAMLGDDKLIGSLVYLRTAVNVFQMLVTSDEFLLQPEPRLKDDVSHTHLLIGDALYKRGLFGDALREIEKIRDRFEGERSAAAQELLAWYFFKQGLIYGAMRSWQLARSHLNESLRLAGGSYDYIRQAAYLNLASIERGAAEAEKKNTFFSNALARQHLEKALEHVKAAEELGAEKYDVYLQRGIALVELKRFTEAKFELEKALATAKREKVLWEIEYNRGRSLQALNETKLAIAAYRKSCEYVKTLLEKAGEHSSEVAAEYRAPFFRLFGLHARSGEWEQALEVVAELDWFSTGATAAKNEDELDPPKAAALLERWRGRHLVVLIPDEDRLWSLEVQDRQLTGRDVGERTEIEKLAKKLEASPGDLEVASALGGKILPPLVEEGNVVEFFAVGSMASVPLPALRRGETLAISRTPLARIVTLRSYPFERKTPSKEMVVIGNPGDDLPEAEAEARHMAQFHDVLLFTGASANREALYRSRNAALLYVAGHSRQDELGLVLPLFGSSISANEIRSKGLAPSVVVLSSCGSAVAQDDAGWGSLAGAFLDAGSRAVIASSQTVKDRETFELTKNLDLKLVVTNPAKALAAAQVKADESHVPIADWASFSVILAPP